MLLRRRLLRLCAVPNCKQLPSMPVHQLSLRNRRPCSAGAERRVLLWPPKGNINRKVGELAGHGAGVVQVVMADACSQVGGRLPRLLLMQELFSLPCWLVGIARGLQQCHHGRWLGPTTSHVSAPSSSSMPHLQAITLAEDHTIRVWDLRNHGCIQTISRAGGLGGRWGWAGGVLRLPPGNDTCMRMQAAVFEAWSAVSNAAGHACTGAIPLPVECYCLRPAPARLQARWLQCPGKLPNTCSV